MFDDWPKDFDGKVLVLPLVGYETFVPHGVLCGLKVHYLESPAELLDADPSSIPLIMTPEMARGLATALSKAADEAEQGPRDGGAH